MKKVALIAVVLLLAIGIFFYQAKKDTQKDVQQNKGSLAAETPAPIRGQQKKQLDEGKSTDTTKKLFEITAGNYYFSPNTITVNRGDQITLMLFTKSGSHTFTIDNLSVETQTLRPNQPAVVTFTADKKGTYDFYSTIDQDRQKGMKGTLIVK